MEHGYYAHSGKGRNYLQIHSTLFTLVWYLTSSLYICNNFAIYKRMVKSESVYKDCFLFQVKSGRLYWFYPKKKIKCTEHLKSLTAWIVTCVSLQMRRNNPTLGISLIGQNGYQGLIQFVACELITTAFRGNMSE